MVQEAIVLSPLLKGALVLILVGILVYFVYKTVKKVVLVLLNSFLGLVLLIALNFAPFMKLPITLWSVLLVLFGGLLGLVAAVILHLLGISL
ncbi:Uncharacterised protein [uncultured archaeon]|nr:Uncharacterised protein [uncultured archaeon]